jgi:hypothetical protein
MTADCDFCGLRKEDSSSSTPMTSPDSTRKIVSCPVTSQKVWPRLRHVPAAGFRVFADLAQEMSQEVHGRRGTDGV